MRRAAQREAGSGEIGIEPRAIMDGFVDFEGLRACPLNSC